MAAGIHIRNAADTKAFESEDGFMTSRRLVGPTKGSEHLSVDLVTIAVGYDDVAEYESSDEAMYMLKGAAEIEFDGSTRRLEPGSLIFVPMGTKYRWKVIDGPNEMLVMFTPTH
jgi:quercetin dioxygenase-like cupin family protein